MIDSAAGLHAEHRTTWHRLQQLEAAAAGALFPGPSLDGGHLDHRAAPQPRSVRSGL